MSEVFLKIVNMSVSASWIVLAILLLRLLLKKAPKWITVLLWGVVAIRLICPFSIESVMSLIPSAETVSPSVLISEAEINTGFETIDNVINPVISEATTTIGTEKAVNTFKLFILIFSKVWLIGIVILLVYTFISYWRVRRKVRTAVLLRDNVYQSEAVVSPFVLGVIKPKIYIPFNMGKQDEKLVIAHEQAHIKRKDHWWKPLGFLILTLHWFNPLMWLGYVLLCRDIEIACDEKVVKELTNEQRADYSQALLTCSVNRRMIAACPLAFGEVGIKERVKSVLNYKKPAFWIIVVSVIAIVITSICLLTNPKIYDASDLDDKLQVLIDTSIAEHNESEYTKDNFIVVDYKIMDIDNSFNETSVYMWVLYMEYSCKDGVLTNEAGAHIPTVITAKKNGNKYELVEYWTPRDGSYYASDIKDKFPRRLWSDALDSQQYIDEQTAKCERDAKLYFGISKGDNSQTVTENLINGTIFFYNEPTAENTTAIIENIVQMPEEEFNSFIDRIENQKWVADAIVDRTTFYFDCHISYDDLIYISFGEKVIYYKEHFTNLSDEDAAFIKSYSRSVSAFIDSVAFDIDNDGVVEACTLRFGPTSGLFTFIISVSENGKPEYFNIFHSPTFYNLSFENTEKTLRLKGITQGDNPKTEHFDIVIDNNNICLFSDVQNIEYWGEQGLDSPYASKS
ncbi:MAG: M56 family metallopeptidase [Clostridia bacterium]|nr:M56 family metallopeptidase [Clostridia bacterium]